MNANLRRAQALHAGSSAAWREAWRDYGEAVGRAKLEANLVAHGCRDPLVVWEETGVLLDGHNRLRICQAHGLPFATALVSLPDRDAAADWMDANQLGRRNLSPDQASLLRGRRYNRAKRSVPNASGRNQHSEVGTQNEGQPKTAERLASEHGVSRATIERDGAFATAVEKARVAVPDLDARIARGQAPPKSAVVQAAYLLDEAPEVAVRVLDGTFTAAGFAPHPVRLQIVNSQEARR